MRVACQRQILGRGPELHRHADLVDQVARAGADDMAAKDAVGPGIRQQLAQEDVEWRSNHSRRLLETWARTDVYYRAYESMTLDSWAEQTRWQRAGAKVSTPPPVEIVE